jgi:hypothetical protein
VAIENGYNAAMDKAFRNSSQTTIEKQQSSPQVEYGAGSFSFLILFLMTTALIGVAQELPDPLRWFTVSGGLLILGGFGLKLIAHFWEQAAFQNEE